MREGDILQLAFFSRIFFSFFELCCTVSRFHSGSARDSEKERHSHGQNQFCMFNHQNSTNCFKEHYQFLRVATSLSSFVLLLRCCFFVAFCGEKRPFLQLLEIGFYGISRYILYFMAIFMTARKLSNNLWASIGCFYPSSLNGQRIFCCE